MKIVGCALCVHAAEYIGPYESQTKIIWVPLCYDHAVNWNIYKRELPMFALKDTAALQIHMLPRLPL